MLGFRYIGSWTQRLGVAFKFRISGRVLTHPHGLDPPVSVMNVTGSDGAGEEEDRT